VKISFKSLKLEHINMAIIQWRPFRDITHWESLPTIETLQEEMNRLFHQLSPSGNGDSELMAFMPSAELEDTPDAIHLKLEIPGLEAKDLDIQVTEQSVSISGERKSETKTEEKGSVRSEFRYGKFERIIPLPVPVKTDAAHAEYKNGILTLDLPKTAEDRKKVVKVEVN
jgi:HSP20 family protein